MGQASSNAPFTEPVEVECQFVSGAAVEVSKHTVQLIGWTNIVHLGKNEADERRITLRVVMARDVGDQLKTALVGGFREERH